MLVDNIRIEKEKGEYKDFPYKYKLYLYGTCVWTDDFSEPLTDCEVVKEFAKELKYVAEEL